MLECYSIIFCEKSILDVDSHNFSAINMIQEIRTTTLGVSLPFSTLTFWTSSTSDPVSMKIKLVLESENGEHIDCSTVNDVKVDKSHFRVRIIGLAMPPKEGNYNMRVHCEFNDGTIQLSKCFWRLAIKKQIS